MLLEDRLCLYYKLCVLDSLRDRHHATPYKKKDTLHYPLLPACQQFFMLVFSFSLYGRLEVLKRQTIFFFEESESLLLKYKGRKKQGKMLKHSKNCMHTCMHACLTSFLDFCRNNLFLGFGYYKVCKVYFKVWKKWWWRWEDDKNRSKNNKGKRKGSIHAYL